MPFGSASRLGGSLFNETPPVEWVPGRSQDKAETIIWAVYRQVLGNAYITGSERLQHQLSDMRPFATIGAAQIKSDWRHSDVSPIAVAWTSLQQPADAQSERITHLQEQLADARRYAVIGGDPRE